nr:class I SAM-dependent methyltransferase [uncultured Rhodoferax sp.]
MNTKLRSHFAARQFKPDIVGVFINPFFLARRGLWREIEAASAMLAGDLLDVGCGTKPYQSLFTVRSYTGLEIDTPIARQRDVAEAYYDGKSFPFEDASFDAVLCNQVLEHVFTPDEFLQEVFRVLRPQGRLLLTVPFVWDEHEQPYDYARYSSFGLRALLDRNGFQIVRQRKTLADASLLFQMANAYLFKVTGARSILARLLLRVFLFAPVSMLGLLASLLLPRNEDFFLDQLVVAERSAEAVEGTS